jgi:hypothetical protein
MHPAAIITHPRKRRPIGIDDELRDDERDGDPQAEDDVDVAYTNAMV